MEPARGQNDEERVDDVDGVGGRCQAPCQGRVPVQVLLEEIEHAGEDERDEQGGHRSRVKRQGEHRIEKTKNGMPSLLNFPLRN